MSSYEQLLAAVTQHPEDDAARLAFAEGIRAGDPDRAAFVDHQVEEARQRRSSGQWANPGRHPLLAKHEEEWSRTIARYATAWKWDRGFITGIEIDPHLFLEYGEWLMINAPIRQVSFSRPEDDEMPIAALAKSPLLATLDAIRFGQHIALDDASLIALVDGGQLERALELTLDDKRPLGPAVYEAFAASPQTRKLLRFFVPAEGFPGQTFGDTGRDDWWGAAVLGYSDVPAAGHALEQKYGYLPWVHPEDNALESFDLRHYVDREKLPAKPPGSPVS